MGGLSATFPHERGEIARDCLAPSAGQAAVERPRPLRGCVRDHDDGIQVEGLVGKKSIEVILDEPDLGVVVRQSRVDIGLPLGELDPIGGIGLRPAAHHAGEVSLGPIRERTDRADIEGQGLATGHRIDGTVFLVDASGEDDVHLPEFRPRRDRLDVLVDEVAVQGADDRVQPDTLGLDGRLHITAVHPLLRGDAAAVPLHCDMVRVMLECFTLGDAVGGEEPFVRYLGRIGLEGEHLRDVALQEDLELADVDEFGRVRNNLRKEALVLLITLQLCLPVSFARDDDRL